jgi:DNA mismatch endonuclease (patch repair protein)
VFTPEKRSEVMSRVRSKDTKPELAVRRALHAIGYRFRLHRGDLPDKPDVVVPKYRTALFVHGCFWHRHPGCTKARLPKNNADFWREKLQGNVERDERPLFLPLFTEVRGIVFSEVRLNGATASTPDRALRQSAA